MAGPPVFPGDNSPGGTSRTAAGDGVRARVGDGDASRLRNLVQDFLTNHDGDRAYEQACVSGKQFLSDLMQAKPREQRGDTPGRMAAKRAAA
jgi:hypothetical protein